MLKLEKEDSLEVHLKEQLNQPDDYFWHELRHEAVMQNLDPKYDGNILDIGSGAGLLGKYCSKHYPNSTYHFIEPIESLQKKLINTYGEKKDFYHKKDYDNIQTVVMLDVLEHQKDDTSFLESTFNKMKSGTTIILTVPALNLLWSHWDESAGHYRRYTKTSLQKSVSKLPVTIKSCYYLFPEMLLPGIFRKLKPSKNSSILFPVLTPFQNKVLTNFGRIIQKLKSITPFGSSLIMTLTKN